MSQVQLSPAHKRFFSQITPANGFNVPPNRCSPHKISFLESPSPLKRSKTFDEQKRFGADIVNKQVHVVRQKRRLGQHDASMSSSNTHKRAKNAMEVDKGDSSDEETKTKSVFKEATPPASLDDILDDTSTFRRSRRKYTAVEVRNIVEEAIERRDEQLREEYDRILGERLREQYDAFCSYQHDYMSRTVRQGDLSYCS